MTFVLREMIRDLLMENRLEKFKELYGSPKTAKRPIPEVLLHKIIMGDPTTLPRTATSLKEVKKVGEYTQWLIKQFYKIYPHRNEEGKIVPTPAEKENIRLFFEDLYRATEALEKFDVMKRKHKLPEDKKDINRVQTISELEDMTEHFDLSGAQETNAEKKTRIVREDADLVYEDGQYEVLIPKTYEASNALGGPPLTRWCTAASSESGEYRFNYYTKTSYHGPLYIIRDKRDIVEAGRGAGEPRPILQIHFNSKQFKDRADNEVDVKRFFSDKKGLKEFFKKPFEEELASVPFNMKDNMWSLYLGLYGASGDVRNVVLDALRVQVSQRTQLKVVDRNVTSNELDVTSFVEMLGYPTVFHKVLEFASPAVSRLEFLFRNYREEGIDVPAHISRFVNAHTLMLSGFVKSLPPSMGNMKSLRFLVIADNPNLHEVPEELGNAPLEAYNSKNTPAPVPQSVLAKETADDLFLIIQ